MKKNTIDRVCFKMQSEPVEKNRTLLRNAFVEIFKKKQPMRSPFIYMFLFKIKLHYVSVLFVFSLHIYFGN